MIRLRNIHKKYNENSFGEVHALKGITMDIHKGEMIAVMGPSGSGKSTLLNIIGCMDSVTSGEYIMDGQDLTQATADQLAVIRNVKIGFVFQGYGLIGERSIEENILIPLLFAKEPLRRSGKRIDAVLEALNIAHLAKRPASQLSGGQAQRVAIARALVNEPELILADEPTGALDSATAEEMMDVLTELNQRGKTIVIVTHNPDVAKCCGKICRIQDGLLKENAI